MLKTLLEKLENLQGIDMTKLTATMFNTSDAVGNLNMDVVKPPNKLICRESALPAEMLKLW